MKNDTTSNVMSFNNLIDLKGIEAQVREYETLKRKELGLDENHQQWVDNNPKYFTKAQRQQTILLHGGFTVMHDKMIEAAFKSLGYQPQALDTPDNTSFQYGKEFGNRGQCNPTYFTVGNLIKHLCYLRDEAGKSTEDIIKNYVFLTAGGCGPCRFGMYVTEYRKALRDAGFEGFRVLMFENDGNLNQSSDEAGLALTPKFFISLVKAIIAGDVINAIGYRMRPYEIVSGATDEALQKCRHHVYDAILHRCSLLMALYQCRQFLRDVKLNRLQPKPKVSIIGEFWAVTTEGEGNYRLQRFLESEGAECDIQLITGRILHNVWEAGFNIRSVMMLPRIKRKNKECENNNDFQNMIGMKLAQFVLEKSFYLFAHAIGLKKYKLPDFNELEKLGGQFYDASLHGGEGHTEVAHLIEKCKQKAAHLIISVKPFGCMPSSGVSDGVQSLVTARYPDANFVAIETSGDGATGVYSRVQMALFKARQSAQDEFNSILEKKNIKQKSDLNAIPCQKHDNDYMYQARHVVAGTAANLVLERS